MSTPLNDQWQLPRLDQPYRAHQFEGASETNTLPALLSGARLRRASRHLGTTESQVHEVTEKQQAPLRPGVSPPNRAPITPAEPLDNTQAEVPKVGNTDAPGG